MTARWIADERPAGSADVIDPQGPGRGIVDILFVVAVVAIMALSDYALEYFGIPYSSPTGSILSKIHPATYLFGLALALAVIANRNPLTYALNLFLRRPGSGFLLVSCLLLWVFISRYKPDYSASFLADALMVAAMISMLFADANERARGNVARAVHILLVLNCIIAIIEASTGWRLFPFVLLGHDQTWDYRATALFGHPLNGALITGVYAVILMTVPNVRGLSERFRLPLVLLCMATMPFVGARTSFTIVYATAAAAIGLRILRFLRGGTVRVRTLLQFMIVGVLGIVAIVTMLELGIFDNFLERFSDDSGSAETRVLLFQLFDNFGLRDLLMGQSDLALETNVRLNGLTNGIESSWAGHLVRYGLVMSTVLWFGIAGWFAEMLRVSGRGAILPLVFVFLVISTSVGISAKTTMLSIPAILILALVQKGPANSPSLTGKAGDFRG